jgi:hypothetical protein
MSKKDRPHKAQCVIMGKLKKAEKHREIAARMRRVIAKVVKKSGDLAVAKKKLARKFKKARIEITARGAGHAWVLLHLPSDDYPQSFVCDR